MLKRIICALMSAAMLVNSGMIASATEGTTESTTTYSESAVAEEEEPSTTVVEATVTSAADAEETTTTTAEPMTPEEIGAAMRETLDVKVCDIIAFDDITCLYDAKAENTYYVDIGWRVWIIGIDDKNQRFRVQSPKVFPNGEVVTYLKYEDAKNAVVLSKGEGHVVGDVNYDYVINAKDFTLLKRWLIYGWNMETDKTSYNLSDWDGDGKVAINDLVGMQKFLLGQN